MLNIIIFIIYVGIPMKQIQNKCAVIRLKNHLKMNVTDLDLISVQQLANVNVTPVGLNFYRFL